MQLIKTYRLILCIAAILFIARPFIGFSVADQLQDKDETSLFVKIFSKRKPEFLEEAGKRFSEIHKLLTAATCQLQNSFAIFLASLFSCLIPFLCSPFNRQLIRLRQALASSAPIFLLTRQLTI